MSAPPHGKVWGNRFMGKRVLVTGAAGDIGRCVAERFACEGAEVIGLDRRQIQVPFRLLQVNLSDPAEIQRICDQLKQEDPGLDVLANVAGVLKLGNSDTLSHKDWQECLDVNASGPFYLMQHWTPVFRQQRRGAIINIASNAAHIPRINMAGYCASKAALLSLSQCVALELAPYGVRCNVVSPGSTRGAMLNKMLASPQGERSLIEGLPEQFKLGIPLAKVAVPEDIADAVLFLASDHAGHISMQDIVVDGGATLGA